MEVVINNASSCLINSSLASCSLSLASPFIYQHLNHNANYHQSYLDANILNSNNANSRHEDGHHNQISETSLNVVPIINGYPVSDWNLYEARANEHQVKGQPISVGWDGVPSNFDGYHIIDSLRENMNVIYVIAAMYVIGVFWGQRFMANRKPLQLKTATILWNLFLALFSTICFVKFSIESWEVYQRPVYQDELISEDANDDKTYIDANSYQDANSNTFSYSSSNFTTTPSSQKIPYGGLIGIICHTPTGYGSHAFWQLLFIASKVWEFGDTVLLISRKRPVIFLHWFHHTTVLLLSCFIGGRNSSLRRVFANVNSGIHALMYTYYAIVAAGYRFPRSVSMTITASQLIQMVIGVYACIKSYSICVKPDGVLVDHSSATFSLVIYASYLLLFAQFFHKAYIARKDAKKSIASQDNEKITGSSSEDKKKDSTSNGVLANGVLSNQIINNNEERLKSR